MKKRKVEIKVNYIRNKKSFWTIMPFNMPPRFTLTETNINTLTEYIKNSLGVKNATIEKITDFDTKTIIYEVK